MRNPFLCFCFRFSLVLISVFVLGGCDDGSESGSSSGGGCDTPSNNFAVNGDVEDGLINWSTTGGGILTRTMSDMHSGSASAMISGRWAAWHGITFNPGGLANGITYDVSVWVKLAPESPNAEIYLTANRQDDSNGFSNNEYIRVAVATANADGWTQLRGTYTQSGTFFEHFIIRSDNNSVSYYVDDFSIAVNQDGGQVSGCGENIDRSFILTSVQNNLDNSDMRIIEDGLGRLGYTKVLEDTNVSSSNLTEYLGRNITTLYHTGHGEDGAVNTSDNTKLYYDSGVTLRVQNTIFATCLTLSTTGWRNTFSSTAEILMGYTKTSNDFVDETVAKFMINQLRRGRSYKLAWYLANSGVYSLSDRWAEYVREGDSIVEYSARSESIPKYDVSQLIDLETKGIVRAIADLIRSSRKFKSSLGMRASIDSSEVTTTAESGDLDLTTPITITEQEAIVLAGDWLAANDGLPEDAVVDRVIAIHRQADDDPQKNIVGYTVHFRRNHNGTRVSGNRIEDHINILVDQNSVVAVSRYWPELKKIEPASDDGQEHLLSVGDAIQTAAEEIANTVKQDKHVSIIEAEPVYGTPGPRGIERMLVPAYRVKSAEGHTFVINAFTGKLVL